ncbi:MAG: hypothetical protein GY835_25180 [bacterium]|nr:hypothetical protein [bacterium]
MPQAEAAVAGLHHNDWSRRDDRNRDLASGIYFARLNPGTAQKMVRMVLLR